MPQVKGCRRFCIFTTPHMADPVWLNPGVEMQDSDVPGERPATIEYTDTIELEKVVLQLGKDRARAAGYDAGARHALALFGHTMEEYTTKLREKAATQKKEKKALDKETPKA